MATRIVSGIAAGLFFLSLAVFYGYIVRGVL